MRKRDREWGDVMAWGKKKDRKSSGLTRQTERCQRFGQGQRKGKYKTKILLKKVGAGKGGMKKEKRKCLGRFSLWP